MNTFGKIGKVIEKLEKVDEILEEIIKSIHNEKRNWEANKCIQARMLTQEALAELLLYRWIVSILSERLKRGKMINERMITEVISAKCVCPAPMMSETDRQKRVADMRKFIYANKYMIIKEWRVHNPVFDKKDEKTTTKFHIRPAKTIDELEFIVKELEV